MSSVLFGIQDKVALVTGGARGIGLMITQAYVEAGAKVYISSRNVQACEKAAAELSADGACIAIPADLSTTEGIATLSAELQRRESKLNILVNNSGKTWGAPIEKFPRDAWESVLAINLTAPFELTRDLLPLLEAASDDEDPARVINIGSASGILTETLRAYSYAASKAAIHHLTRVLAQELAARNITVNAIAPGFFPSKMTKFLIEDEKVYAGMLAEIPLHRFGTAADIGGLAIYLASRAGAFMTGNVLALDGGLTVASPLTGMQDSAGI